MRSSPAPSGQKLGLLVNLLRGRGLGASHDLLSAQGILGALVAWPSVFGASFSGGLLVLWLGPCIGYTVEHDFAWAYKWPFVVGLFPVAFAQWVDSRCIVLLIEIVAELDTLLALLASDCIVGCILPILWAE